MSRTEPGSFFAFLIVPFCIGICVSYFDCLALSVQHSWMRLSEESTAESDSDGLNLSVVGERIFAELTANTGLLKTTEGHLVADHVVDIDLDGTGLE